MHSNKRILGIKADIFFQRPPVISPNPSSNERISAFSSDLSTQGRDLIPTQRDSVIVGFINDTVPEKLSDAEDRIRARPRIRRSSWDLEEESEAEGDSFDSDSDEYTDLDYDSEKEDDAQGAQTGRADDLEKLATVANAPAKDSTSPGNQLSISAPAFTPASVPTPSNKLAQQAFRPVAPIHHHALTGPISPATPHQLSQIPSKVPSYSFWESLFTIEMIPEQWHSGRVDRLTDDQKTMLLTKAAWLYGIPASAIPGLDRQNIFRAAINLANARLQVARYNTPRPAVLPYVSSAIPIVAPGQNTTAGLVHSSVQPPASSSSSGLPQSSQQPGRFSGANSHASGPPYAHQPYDQVWYQTSVTHTVTYSAAIPIVPPPPGYTSNNPKSKSRPM
ncbi:hypothetical protein FRC02_001554 [Tulasnella sp. 418]|nr:hypothetical protein FRC02_001554 [Tulasnella sp. 418]